MLHGDGHQVYSVVVPGLGQEAAVVVAVGIGLHAGRIHQETAGLAPEAVERLEDHQRVAEVGRVGGVLRVGEAGPVDVTGNGGFLEGRGGGKGDTAVDRVPRRGEGLAEDQEGGHEDAGGDGNPCLLGLQHLQKNVLDLGGLWGDVASGQEGVLRGGEETRPGHGGVV